MTLKNKTGKRIGILTFHFSKNNFGAVLQTYASYSILKKIGYSPVVINLLPHKNNTSFSYLISKLISSIINRSNNFDRFRKKYLTLTKKVYSYEDCKKLNQSIDAFYVGSDQIWRPSMAGKRLFRYFLDFADETKLKISYAASFGSSSWEGTEKEKQTVANLLKRFSAISVREDVGVELCRNEFSVKAKHVLDPTLLLTQNDLEVIESVQINKLKAGQKYVGFYLLDDVKGSEKIPELIRTQLKMEAFNLYGENRKLPGRTVFQYGTVGRWLSGMKNSILVVTDSFHCIIFSIIYRRDFVCLKNEKKGASRIISLLSALNLEDRYLTEADIDFAKYLKPINYDAVNARLEVLQKDSYDFLISALTVRKSI